ncbi:WD40-repeat-containing domain protein [Globomyces pollinis-pini]|nr:WD40-repeat-containing domain protein [Globomyces pollinis-pini]
MTIPTSPSLSISCHSPVYSIAFSNNSNNFTLAYSSFNPNLNNSLHILSCRQNNLSLLTSLPVAYPITKLLWAPNAFSSTEFLATTSDYFRLWEFVTPDVDDAPPLLICRATLSNVRKVGQNKQELCAPLTSFDWNDIDSSLCVTSSLDTTCTIWDMNTQQAKTQLIAHDSDVLDVAFADGVNCFASVGADGSVRMFDQRSLAHSTIIYETTPVNGNTSKSNPSLIRLGWNKKDPNYLATFQQDSKSVVLLDIRVPAVPISELHGHTGDINAIHWAPHSSSHIASAGEKAFIWDILTPTLGSTHQIKSPIKQYDTPRTASNITWSKAHPDWIAVCSGDEIHTVHI